MNPEQLFCPNIDCPARGQQGQDNIHIHSQQEKRCRCDICGQTFATSKGTIFYRLRTSPETVMLVVTLIAYGCPVPAIVRAFGFDERTVSQGLYGFKHPSQYDADWLLRPIRKIREKLVVEEWENMQRIIVSLALKTTTQSIIIGKLSAYARKNKTKRALWEYDNIIRSLYLLNYVDLLSLRRHVQQAVNRGENYHKLHKAVSLHVRMPISENYVSKQKGNNRFGMNVVA